MLQVGVYKRSQGRITRQVTFAALALGVGIGLWRLSDWLRTGSTAHPWIYFGVPALLLGIGVWISYRVVNLPAFADFLIGVEAEMNKVSWPSRGELFRASLVVMVSIIVLGCLLALFDLLWIWVFSILGIY